MDNEKEIDEIDQKFLYWVVPDWAKPFGFCYLTGK